MRQAKKQLVQAKKQAEQVKRQLRRLIAALTETIEAARGLLMENESLDPDQEAEIDEALDGLKGQPAAAENATEGLRMEVDQVAGEVAETIDQATGPPLVTGPASCGTNSEGETVVVNTGTVSCQEAIELSETPRDAVPAGWSCLGTATTIEGSELVQAQGYSCSRGETRVSIHVADSQPLPESGGGSGRCPPGYDFNKRIRDCVVAETGEENAGQPYVPPSGD